MDKKLLLRNKINKKTIVIYQQSDKFYKDYYYIARFIFNSLKLIKEDLPYYTKVIIRDTVEYDNEDTYTHIRKLKTSKNFRERCVINFNIKEIIGYYNDRDFFRLYCQGFQDKITLKTLIRFVLYHELGHYKNKDIYNCIDYMFNIKVAEDKADFYSVNVLSRFNRQLYFDFYVNCV